MKPYSYSSPPSLALVLRPCFITPAQSSDQGIQSSDQGMYLAQFYGTSVVSPNTTSPHVPCTVLWDFCCLPHHYVRPFDPRDHFHGSLTGYFFPVGALSYDSPSWRDLFTENPLLVSVDQIVQSLWRIYAQRTRDLDRATRGNPPYVKTSR